MQPKINKAATEKCMSAPTMALRATLPSAMECAAWGKRQSGGRGIDRRQAVESMRVDRRQLRPYTADPSVHNRAQQLADSWRETGLVVDLVEYMVSATDPGGYVLTGRSQSSVISCRCQVWLYRRWPWGGRSLWTIVVSVRAAHPTADVRGPPPPPARQAGFAAAWEHDAAWEIVQGWIDGTAPLSPTLADALLTLQ